MLVATDPRRDSFPSSVASSCLVRGSLEEVAFLLGHHDPNMSRAGSMRDLLSPRRSGVTAELGELFPH